MYSIWIWLATLKEDAVCTICKRGMHDFMLQWQRDESWIIDISYELEEAEIQKENKISQNVCINTATMIQKLK